MADVKVKMTKLMLTGPLRPELLCLAMKSAAAEIGVNQKYMFELIKKNELTRVTILDGRGEEIGVGITVDSVDEYRRRYGIKRRRSRMQHALPLDPI